MDRALLGARVLLVNVPIDVTVEGHGARPRRDHAHEHRPHARRVTPSGRVEAVELGLAITWERLGTINRAFLPDTRIDSERIRAILLALNSASVEAGAA